MILGVAGLLLAELPLFGGFLLLHPLSEAVFSVGTMLDPGIPFQDFRSLGLAIALSAASIGYLQSRINPVLLNAGTPVPEGPTSPAGDRHA
jgi:hypothetical protein